MSALSPFRWREYPRASIFVGAPGFPPPTKSGHTRSTQMTATVIRQTAATGRNPGTLSPLTVQRTGRVGYEGKR